MNKFVIVAGTRPEIIKVAPIIRKLIEKKKDFKFIYEIGLAPEFELKITKKDKLNYHKIKVDDKLIMSYCKDITKRHGKMTNPDISEDGDSIFCAIIQLDVDGKINELLQNFYSHSMIPCL